MGKRPNPACLSNILFSFYFGFFRCTENHRWRLAVPGQKANNAFWSAHVCGLVSKRSGRGGLLPPTRSSDSKVDAVGAPSAERGGSAQACRRPAEIAPKKAGTAAEERTAEQAQEAAAQSLQRAYGQRFDCASRVPQ